MQMDRRRRASRSATVLFNVIIQSFYAVDLLFVCRYDGVTTQARKVLQTGPGAPVGLSALYQALLAKQMYTEAIALDMQQFADDPEPIPF